MPRAWSQKDERQYKRILKSCRKTKCERKGKRSTCKLSEKELEACKRVAAATVNKRRRKERRTKTRGVHLRGLEGALSSGSYEGAPGKIIHRDMSPEKIELGYRRAGRVTKMCPALRFDAGEYDAGVEITAFTVPSREEGGRGQYAGRIDAEIRGGDLQVMFAEIEPELRRCGVGTRLYETLMRIAQKKKLRLVSDSQRSDGAEAFWLKQVKKNRAECIDDRGGHKYTPGSGVEPNVWPCRRFALKRRVRSLRGRRA